jgi:hypothetical protein
MPGLSSLLSRDRKRKRHKLKKNIIFAGIALNVIILAITVPLIIKSTNNSRQAGTETKQETASDAKDTAGREEKKAAVKEEKKAAAGEEKKQSREKRATGKTETLNEATAQSAILQIITEPAGAKIFVNGYYKGKTPTSIVVNSVTKTPVIYGIKLVKEGYKPVESKVKLISGDRKKYRIVFKNKTGSNNGK